MIEELVAGFSTGFVVGGVVLYFYTKSLCEKRFEANKKASEATQEAVVVADKTPESGA